MINIVSFDNSWIYCLYNKLFSLILVSNFSILLKIGFKSLIKSLFFGIGILKLLILVLFNQLIVEPLVIKLLCNLGIK